MSVTAYRPNHTNRQKDEFSDGQIRPTIITIADLIHFVVFAQSYAEGNDFSK